MDIGTLTGAIAIEDQLSGVLTLIVSHVQSFTSDLGGLFGAMTAGFGIATGVVTGFVAAVTALGTKGADINDVTTTFANFSGSAENAADTLRKLEAGTLGTVDKFDLMKSSSKLLAAGIKLTADNFGTLGSAAFVLQNQGLGPTKDMLDLVSQALLTGRTRTLEMRIGKIDLAKAEREYAASLGVEKLDQMQKVEAHRVGILAKLNEKVVEAGAQTRDFGEQIEFMQTKFANWLDDLASATAKSPVLARGMDTLAKAFDNAFGSDREAQIKTIVGLIEDGTIHTLDFGIATLQVANVFHTAWAGLQIIVLGVTTAIFGTVTSVLKLSAVLAEVTAALPLASAAAKQQAISTRNAADLSEAMTKSLYDQTVEAGRAVLGQSEFNKTLDKLGGALFVTRDALVAAKNAGQAAAEETKKRTENTKSGAEVDAAAAAAAAAYAQKLVEVDKRIAEYSAGLEALSDANMNSIDSYTELGLSVDDIAIKLKKPAIAIAAYLAELEKQKKVEIEAVATAERLASFEHALYEQKRADNARLAAEELRTNRERAANISSLEAVQRDYAQRNRERLLTGTALELEKFRVVKAEALANLGERTAANAEFWDNAKAEMDVYFDNEKERIEDSKNNWMKEIDTLAGAMTQIAQVSGDAFGGIVKDIANVVVAVNLAVKAVKAYQEATTAAQKAAALAAGAAAVVQATGQGSTGSRVVGGALAGAAAGSIVPGAGTAIGAIAGALIGLYRGMSAASKAARQLVADTEAMRRGFISAAGGIRELDQRAFTAGVTLDHLLDARTPEAYKAAIDELNQAFQFQDTAMQLLDETAEKYGITLSEMGPKYRQGKLDEAFAQLFQDQKILQAGGVDYDLILRKQAESYKTLIQTAIETGATIPLAMREAIERMIDLGLFTDEAGKAMFDLTKLNFAETLDAKFETLISTIGRLVEAIERGLSGAIKAIPSPRAPWADWGQPPGYPPGKQNPYSDEEPIYAAKGRVIPFTPRGTDTVPAMLTPGEEVIPAGQRKQPIVIPIELRAGNEVLARHVVKTFVKGGL